MASSTKTVWRLPEKRERLSGPGADGHLEVDGLGPDFALDLAARGRAPARLSAGPESAGERELVLGPGGFIEVQVTDGAGQPVRGALVEAIDGSGWDLAESMGYDPLTGRDGALAVGPLPPGGYRSGRGWSGGPGRLPPRRRSASRSASE